MTASGQRNGKNRVSGLFRVAGLFRVVVLFFTVFLGTGFFAYRTAEANMGELLLSYADQIARWQGVSPHSGTRTLRLNGAEIRVATVFFKESLEGVLDRLESDCQSRGRLTLGGSSEAVNLPTLRYETGKRGVVSCLDFGGVVTVAELGERLQQFANSTNISAVGSPRYAVASEGKRGTSVLLIWNDGDLPLADMFPSDESAPGVDPKGIPLPQGARRIVSTSESGAPYSANIYRLPLGSFEQAQRHFLDEARAAGWSVSELSSSHFSLRRAGRIAQAHFNGEKGNLSIFEIL